MPDRLDTVQVTATYSVLEKTRPGLEAALQDVRAGATLLNITSQQLKPPRPVQVVVPAPLPVIVEPPKPVSKGPAPVRPAEAKKKRAKQKVVKKSKTKAKKRK